MEFFSCQAPVTSLACGRGGKPANDIEDTRRFGRDFYLLECSSLPIAGQFPTAACLSREAPNCAGWNRCVSGHRYVEVHMVVRRRRLEITSFVL